MGPEVMKNTDPLEQLLGLSGDDRPPVDQKSNAAGRPEAGRGLLIGQVPEVGGVGDSVHQLLSSVNSSGISLDTLSR